MKPYLELSFEDLQDPATYEEYPELGSIINHAAASFTADIDIPIGELKSQMREGLHPDLVYTVLNDRRREAEKAEKKTAGIAALVGEHHGYTIEIIDEQYRIVGPYCQPLVERFRALKGDAKWRDKAWWIKTDRHAALKKILHDLPEMLGIQQQKNSEETVSVERVIGSHNRSGIIYLLIHRQDRLLVIRNAVNISTIGSRLAAAGASYNRTTERWQLAVSKVAALQSIIDDLPILIEQERQNLSKEHQQKLEHQRRYEAEEREEREKAQAKREAEKQVEREAARQIQAKRDEQDGRIYRTTYNHSSQAGAIDAAHQQYDQKMIDGQLYCLEHIIRVEREYGDDGDWTARVSLVPASDEAAAEYEREYQSAMARRNLNALAAQVQQQGEMPEVATIDGETVIDERNIHGTGSYWVVGEYVWYVRQYGNDGDDWSRNNGPGIRAWRIPQDDGIAEKLRRIAEVLNLTPRTITPVKYESMPIESEPTLVEQILKFRPGMRQSDITYMGVHHIDDFERRNSKASVDRLHIGFPNQMEDVLYRVEWAWWYRGEEDADAQEGCTVFDSESEAMDYYHKCRNEYNVNH